MLPGLRLPAVPTELLCVCYKSFSLIFGGDGAGGTDELVLEFLAIAFSSRSWDFSLVLVLLVVAAAPLFSCCGCVFCCCCDGGGAAVFDCQFTSSIDTNFLRRSKY